MKETAEELDALQHPLDDSISSSGAHLTDIITDFLDWGSALVFIRVRPKWMVGYAMNAAEFPS